MGPKEGVFVVYIKTTFEITVIAYHPSLSLSPSQSSSNLVIFFLIFYFCNRKKYYQTEVS